MAQVLDPEVYGEPIYDDALFDADVYGEWFADANTVMRLQPNGRRARSCRECRRARDHAYYLATRQ